MTVKLLTGWNFLMPSVHVTVLLSAEVSSRELAALCSVVILNED